MSGTGSANKTWPEPPDVTIETNSFTLADGDEGRWEEDEFSPAAGTSIFPLSYAPVENSELVSRGGQVKAKPGDYTIAGSTVTLTSPTIAGEKILIKYFTTEAA